MSDELGSDVEPVHVEQLFRETLARIEEYGWTVVGIGASPQWPAFAYTVGLTLVDHPELLISGLPIEVMYGILNTAAGKVAAGERVRPGPLYLDLIRGTETADTQDAMPVRFRLANPRYCVVARKLFGPIDLTVSVLQLLWPDPQGRLPTDPDFDVEGFGRLQPNF